jgi:hypothetical protein
VLVRLYFGDLIVLPLFSNILVKSGVGPTMVRDVFILKLDNLPALPGGFWLLVTALGYVGAVLLITIISLHAAQLIARLVRPQILTAEERIGAFGLLASIIYLMLLWPSPLFFDRYVVPAIPLLTMALIAPMVWTTASTVDASRAMRRTAFALLVAYGLLAIGGTRDYLEWNRTRWTALAQLMRDDGVQPQDIDGGFEFNGLYLYRPPFKTVLSEKSWWWVQRDTYQVGFGPVPGYSIVRQYTYQHWLPWHVQTVVVLRKDGAVP